MWKLFCLTVYFLITANLYSGNVNEYLSPSGGDIHSKKIIFEYGVTKNRDETEFKLYFGEQPQNMDGCLWALSICSYGRLTIKNKDEIVAVVEMSTDPSLSGNVSVFNFKLNNNYIDSSFFTLCADPLEIKDQKEAIIEKWKSFNNKINDKLCHNGNKIYYSIGGGINYIINLKDLIDDAKKKTSSETNKLEKTDR